ncbi:hypothetical protein GALMADRAFT_270629 [Galerina marginata CBS 339.88]|uniref:DUF1275 domain protein n=1 Tax=Galerina marginata (strain CBS 339.88) TaxID=685588 RepID=A0A067SP34_GALM3|nr:hypothetical protein GALMADRAFT_270629 [Galerina marginata CBS 339.88]
MAETEKSPTPPPTHTPAQRSSAQSTMVSTNAKGDLERAGSKDTVTLWTYLMTEVDPAQTTAPLAMYCFMTGYVDVVSFSAIFVWCGFQTGNFAQLAIALARLFEGAPGFRDQTFHKADQQALCSLISFNAGAFVGRIGDRVGAHKRIWLIAGTFIQALMTMASAIAFWKAGQPSIANSRDLPAWTNALTFVGLAFMSASLGVQGILGKRLNTQFGTTIVLTTVWVELMSDPRLFKFRQRVKTRDHRLIAAISLLVGAFVGRCILGQLGTAATMGIGVGFRMFITFSWIFVPNKPPRP